MGRLTIHVHDLGHPIEVECNTGTVSDGYHTFDELYEHRCLLFLAFQAMVHQSTKLYSGCWKSRVHADGESLEGWFISGMTLLQGDISYHIPDKYWDLCKAPERRMAPTWDGNTSVDVINRLKDWLRG